MSKAKLCPRKSIGAVIVQNCRFLCLMRKKNPVGVAGVAGHFDFIDEAAGILEAPLTCLRRELAEEVGIVPVSYKPIFHGVLPNPCSEGFEAHEWHIFSVMRWQGEPVLREPDKHEWVRFLEMEELRPFIERGKVDPAWLMIWSLLYFRGLK